MVYFMLALLYILFHLADDKISEINARDYVEKNRLRHALGGREIRPAKPVEPALRMRADLKVQFEVNQRRAAENAAVRTGAVPIVGRVRRTERNRDKYFALRR